MNNSSTPTDKRDNHGMTPKDWERLHNMTDEEVTAAALSDPDAQPLTDEQLAGMKPRALCKVIRNKLRMIRTTFSEHYGIPLETLKAWERHEAEPTPTEAAYLKLIEREPEIAKLDAPNKNAAE